MSGDSCILIEEPLLGKWRGVAAKNRLLHDAARAHFKGLADMSAVAAVTLGSFGGVANVLLGVSELPSASAARSLNLSQVVLGVTGVASAAIIATSKQLGWEQKHQRHEESAARYGDAVRMINSEATLARLNNSAYASRGEFIKVMKGVMDSIENLAPPIPGFVEARLGKKGSHISDSRRATME